MPPGTVIGVIVRKWAYGTRLGPERALSKLQPMLLGCFPVQIWLQGSGVWQNMRIFNRGLISFLVNGRRQGSFLMDKRFLSNLYSSGQDSGSRQRLAGEPSARPEGIRENQLEGPSRE